MSSRCSRSTGGWTDGRRRLGYHPLPAAGWRHPVDTRPPGRGVLAAHPRGGGAAHHFQTKNPEPEGERRAPDDTETPSISWPNYHSGRNGDFQTITVVEPLHELVRSPGSPAGRIEFFPAHPHEGAVDAPPGDASARVIAKGRSQTTGREFNLVVAFERSVDGQGNRLGRAVAESSFHHFADYNWDPTLGCPSFVTEPAGDTLKNNPHATSDILRYVRNLALWLAPSSIDAL